MNKLIKTFLRPFYKACFERPIWWFLSRVKAYFFAEIGVQLGNMERHLGRDAVIQDQRFAILEERLRRAETANVELWGSLEQLLLAMLRQPDCHQREYLEEHPATPLPHEASQASAAGNLH